jgi:hypothetical protein
MTTDIGMTQMGFMMALRMLIRSPLMFVMAISMAFSINKKLSLVFMCIAPIMFGLIILIGSFAHKRFSAMFKKYDDLNIIITPEGTRKLVNNWKRGFYYIAQKANVPIVLGFLDFKKKELGFGPMLYPTGNYEEDWKEMEKFYRGINAKHPERYNLSK